jgi:hypothetical protein
MTSLEILALNPDSALMDALRIAIMSDCKYVRLCMLACPESHRKTYELEFASMKSLYLGLDLDDLAVLGSEVRGLLAIQFSL